MQKFEGHEGAASPGSVCIFMRLHAAIPCASGLCCIQLRRPRGQRGDRHKVQLHLAPLTRYGPTFGLFLTLLLLDRGQSQTGLRATSADQE